MKGKIIYFVAMLIAVSSTVHAKSKKWQARENFYNEIGCRPLNEGRTRYECPDFKQVINKDKCICQGREYDLGDEVSEFGEPCQWNCYCTKQGEFSKFYCATRVYCPKVSRPIHPLPYTKCIEMYDEDGCCPTHMLCNEELDSLHRCELQGETVYETQTMNPASDCYTCRCVEDFDNSTVVGNPHCREDRCNILENHIEQIYEGCAPIYFNNRCCPEEFVCPSETDYVTWKGRFNVGVCEFGDIQVGVGGEIRVENNKYADICRCVVPPFVECLEKSSDSKVDEVASTEASVPFIEISPWYTYGEFFNIFKK